MTCCATTSTTATSPTEDAFIMEPPTDIVASTHLGAAPLEESPSTRSSTSPTTTLLKDDRSTSRSTPTTSTSSSNNSAMRQPPATSVVTIAPDMGTTVTRQRTPTSSPTSTGVASTDCLKAPSRLNLSEASTEDSSGKTTQRIQEEHEVVSPSASTSPTNGTSTTTTTSRTPPVAIQENTPWANDPRRRLPQLHRRLLPPSATLTNGKHAPLPHVQ
ncbi:hypothetical protein SETIT_9G239100v2 [Setaria italica]|uniref:Uncharacterized protein n=1 Tax=Setaria italica TaxID=4555 RepID=A0A368SJY9_SETIT|nr:hypothetical protein SETIT_9G239100v2 [Setaria italica]